MIEDTNQAFISSCVGIKGSTTNSTYTICANAARMTPDVQAKQLYTREEVIKLLRISPVTFWRHVKSKLINTVKIGNKVLVSAAEINRLLSHGTQGNSANGIHNTLGISNITLTCGERNFN